MDLEQKDILWVGKGRAMKDFEKIFEDMPSDSLPAVIGWTKWFQAAKESEIPALVRFAVQKEKRLPGLTAHAIYSISTGKLEGFNNKIKVAKRIGYGYRDDNFFFTLIRYLSIPSVRSPSHKNRDEPRCYSPIFMFTGWFQDLFIKANRSVVS